MKNTILAAILIAFASSTSAGTLLYTPEVEAVIIEDDAPMGGGSGAWLIPLILLGLLAIAVSGSDDSPPSTNGSNGLNNGGG